MQPVGIGTYLSLPARDCVCDRPADSMILSVPVRTTFSAFHRRDGRDDIQCSAMFSAVCFKQICLAQLQRCWTISETRSRMVCMKSEIGIVALVLVPIEKVSMRFFVSLLRDTEVHHPVRFRDD